MNSRNDIERKIEQANLYCLNRGVPTLGEMALSYSYGSPHLTRFDGTRQASCGSSLAEINAYVSGMIDVLYELPDPDGRCSGSWGSRYTNRELEPLFDGAESFYGKAIVNSLFGDPRHWLYSYGSLAATIDSVGAAHVTMAGVSSATTLRHTKEFLRQNGYPATSKRQLIRDYMTEGDSNED